MYRDVLGPWAHTMDTDLPRRQGDASASDLPIESPWVTGKFYPPGYDEESTTASDGDATPPGQVEEQEVLESTYEQSSVKSSQNFYIASDSDDVFSNGTREMVDDEAASSPASQFSSSGSLCTNCRDKRQDIYDPELKHCFQMKVTTPEQNNVVRLCDVISGWIGSQSSNEKPMLFCSLLECDNSLVNRIGRFQAQATFMNAPIAIVFHYPGRYETEAVVNHTVSLPELFDFGPWGKSTASGQSKRQHSARLKTLVREVHVDNDGPNRRAKRTLTFMRKNVGDGPDGDAWTCVDEDGERDGGPLTYPLFPWIKPKSEIATKCRNIYAVYEPVLSHGGRYL